MSAPLFEIADRKPDPVQKFTERDMLDALHARYSPSQGYLSRYVCAEHVRSACGVGGWDFAEHRARTIRTADFIAQDLWEAQGLALHGHEVKVSRSDWLTELADPDKAEAIKRFCDRWWLVVPDPSIVRDDLPDGWGLLAFGSNGRLRVVRRAPKLDPEPQTRTFAASLLRATAKTAARKDKSE